MYSCSCTRHVVSKSTHTVLDGGPRKWSYEEPSKPMTYQHTDVIMYAGTSLSIIVDTLGMVLYVVL